MGLVVCGESVSAFDRSALGDRLSVVNLSAFDRSALGDNLSDVYVMC